MLCWRSNLISAILVLKCFRNYRTFSSHPYSSRRYCDDNNNNAVCLKTYHARHITTKTYIVKNLKHDLLSGKMLNKAGYRIILDEDPEESGIFAVNEGKICKSKSFSFMGSLTNLYYIKTEPLCLREFGKISGYELWHRRLGHSTNRNIRETIAHSTELEDLRSRTYD